MPSNSPTYYPTRRPTSFPTTNTYAKVSIPGDIALTGLNESTFTDEMQSAFEEGWEAIMGAEMHSTVDVTITSFSINQETASTTSVSLIRTSVHKRRLVGSVGALNIKFLIQLIVGQSWTGQSPSTIFSAVNTNMRKVVANETARLSTAVNSALQARTDEGKSTPAIQWLAVEMNEDAMTSDSVTISTSMPSEAPSTTTDTEHRGNDGTSSGYNGVLIGVVVGVCTFALIGIGIFIRILMNRSEKFALKVSPVPGNV
jgi:hypothetical protein